MSVPGFKPSLLGQNATTLPLAPPPWPSQLGELDLLCCNRQYFASNTNQLFYLISFNSTISKIFFYSSLVFWKFKTNFLESWPLKGFSSIAGSLNSSTMLISLQLHKVDHLIDGSSVQIEFWSIVHIKQVLTWFKLKKCSFYKIVSVSER